MNAENEQKLSDFRGNVSPSGHAKMLFEITSFGVVRVWVWARDAVGGSIAINQWNGINLRFANYFFLACQHVCCKISAFTKW